MENYELGWNDTIEDDGDVVILEPGDHPFRVVSIERGRSKGNADSPPCNMITLNLAILSKENQFSPIGSATRRLYLNKKSEWLLCQFFRAIGMRKHGEKMVMDWQKVPGATGWLTIERGCYEKNGKKYDSNEVKRFLDPDEAPNATPSNDGEMLPF